MQETVMVPFGILGGEEIRLRNWQIIGGKKNQKKKKSLLGNKCLFADSTN